MSQASRSKVLAAKRHRRAVARELADSGLALFRVHGLTPTSGFSGVAEMLCAGDDLVSIDVAAAREHAHELLALADEQAVFEEWMQTKGRGPENREPGAFGGWCPGELRVRADGKKEFWPCWEVPDCTHEHTASGGWPGKLAREWAALGNDRLAPMGRALARLGRRILDALEGQPSECQRPKCSGGTLLTGPYETVVGIAGTCARVGTGAMDCPDCRGSGHNLRGVLPPIAWSPAVRRKVADSVRNGAPPSGVEWTMRLYNEHAELRRRVDELPIPNEPVEAGPNRARVVARGDHRRYVSHDCGPMVMVHRNRQGVPLPDLDARISQRTEYCGARTVPRAHLPKWRRREHEVIRPRRRGSLPS